MLSARSLPRPRADGLGWPLGLLALAAVLALAAAPANGDFEAGLAAAGAASLVVALGVFTISRLQIGGLAVEQAIGAIPAMGIAILALPAFIAALTDFPSLALAVPLFALPLAVLLFLPRGRLLSASGYSEFLRQIRPAGGLVLVALVHATALLVLAILSPRHLDGWATAAIMRAYRDGSDFAFSGDFRRDDNAWPALLAYLSWLFQVDSLVFYRTILPPLVVVAALSSFWSLARTVFNSTPLALLAVAFQALILLTSITAFGFQPGWHLLFSAAEDKTVAAFVLLPVAVTFLLPLLEEGRRRVADWLPFALVAAAIGVIHPIGALLLAMVTTTLLLIRLVVNHGDLRQLVLPFAIVCLSLLPSALVFEDVSSETEDLLSPSGEFFVGNRASLEALEVINFLGDGWAVVHPRTIMTPLLLAGGALALLSLLRPRNIGMQYVLAALAVVVLVAFDPLAIRALSYLVTTQLTWRITWLLPAALGLTLGVSFLLDRVRLKNRTVAFGLCALLVVAIFTVAVTGPWTNRVAENLDVTDAPERELWDAPEGTEALADALRAVAEPGEVVLAPPNYNSVLPAFTSYPEVVFRGLARVRPSPDLGERSERYEDVLVFYVSPSAEGLLEMHEAYGVDYVVLQEPGLCQEPPIAEVDFLLVYRVSDQGC